MCICNLYLFKVKFGQEWTRDNIPNVPSVQSGKWDSKWEINGGRMEAAFGRCGSYDQGMR